APGSAARATSPARLLSWQVLPQRRRRHAGAARGGLRRRAPAVRRARVGVERARPGGGGDVVKGGSAMVLLPIRLVTGWMFFSAFHRRVVLDAAKLTPDAPGYVGEKFNQFMPGAILGVGDLIGALLDRPGALHAFLWTFTIVEALAGLALLLGLGTRLAALGTLLLSAGILAGAGWLGPTCLDEWQIGSLGIAGGATVMLGGAGPFSLDAWLARRWPHLADTRWFRLLADPEPRPARPLVGALAAISIGATLATNQVFHGGL